ncbi:MAG: hypothetical protein ACXAAO_14110 [Candidatus Thorarchaeota archaeon]|jgi:hypothetical protein
MPKESFDKLAEMREKALEVSTSHKPYSSSIHMSVAITTSDLREGTH